MVVPTLHKRLIRETEYVPYSLEGTGSSALCCCDDFLSDEEEFVPAVYVGKAIESSSTETDYEHYLRCCESLGVSGAKDALDRMIVYDDIIANHDCHWRNFGIVRNVNSLECCPAPLFDSGSSLWCNRSLEELAAGEHSFVSAQFYASPAKQMFLVDGMSWFDGDKLNGFVDEAMSCSPATTQSSQGFPIWRRPSHDASTA